MTRARTAPDETSLFGLVRRMTGEEVCLDPYPARCTINPGTTIGRIDGVTDEDLISLQARLQFLFSTLCEQVPLPSKSDTFGNWFEDFKDCLQRHAISEEEACTVLKNYLGLALPEKEEGGE